MDVAQTPALPAHCKAGVVAIAQPIGAAHRRRYLELDAADAQKHIGKGFTFHLQLTLIGDVLPLAPGACAEVSALRLHPVRRCVKHLDNLRRHVAAPLSRYLGHDCFARQPAEHENVLAVHFGHGLAMPAERLQLKREQSSLTRGRVHRHG